MDKSAIVVGSGFGGLAAAIRLRALGFRVTLIEALDQLGGRARVFHRDGFTFDAGPTVITAPYLLDELFALAGRDATDYYSLVAVDPFYRILFSDGGRFDYGGDEQQLLRQIEAFNPADVDGYRRMAAHAERIFEVGYAQLADQSFDRVTDMLRVVPAMLRLESYRTVYGLVSQYIRDERLRQAFTFQPLLVGGNPFATTSIYLLIHWLERKWGVHFPLGGTGRVVQGLARLAEEMGVDIRLSSPVQELVVANGAVAGVVLDHGATLRADVVVCNADPSMVYSQLIPDRHRRARTTRKVKRLQNSMSLFVGYFGAQGSYANADAAHHTVIMGPRYRDLLDDIFERRVLAADFSLYLHAPARSDASLAPQGSEPFYVLSPVPDTRAGIDWEAAAPRYFDRILEEVERRALPGVRANIVHRSHMTPFDFRDTLRSRDGAAFGPAPILTQSAWFRYHNRSPDLRGLYFVGAGTHPGGGVPGVLNSAKVVERSVRTDYGLSGSLIGRSA